MKETSSYLCTKSVQRSKRKRVIPLMPYLNANVFIQDVDKQKHFLRKDITLTPERDLKNINLNNQLKISQSTDPKKEVTSFLTRRIFHIYL